jgi:DNA gyrase subunit A
VLPSSMPQLLLNGSSGIAVGMATNIPPHNLGELLDGVIALIENPEIDNIGLMQYIPGPDFPTGAHVLGTAGIREVYTTGRGSITMRGVANMETIEIPGRPDRDAIIITELPYQTNKAALIERIAELVNDKKLDGISDIRDESDRDGMRIVIELKRDAYPQVVLNNLYKQTPIQSNFSANMLALVNSEPQLLTLKEFLTVFLDFRIETINRRTRFELRKAQERDHLLQGFLTALDHLDAIIALIRRAADAPTAKQEMIVTYNLSEQQSDAILQMQLRRLTALEADKISNEHNDLVARIADLEDILARRERVLAIITEETLSFRKRFANDRRTILIEANGSLETIDLIANERSLILLTNQGYIKRMPVDEFEAQSRATRGKAGARMKDDDVIKQFLTCCDHDSVLFFSDRGVVYRVPAYQIPMGSRNARGTPIVQMLPIPREEKITSIVTVSEFTDDEYLIMLTRGGFIKKTALSAFANIRSNGLIAISLEDSDELSWVRLARAEDSILIGSKKAMTIHFRASAEQLRPLGRSTRGVRAMSLRDGDALISMDILPSAIVASIAESDSDDEADDEDIPVQTQGPWALVVTAKGLGKRVPVTQFRLQKRAGMGLRAIKFRNPVDELISLRIVHESAELMMITTKGVIIRQASDAITQQSRAATGVKLQRLDSDDTIAAVALVPLAPEGTDELDSDLIDVELAEGEVVEVDGADGAPIEAVDADDAAE